MTFVRLHAIGLLLMVTLFASTPLRAQHAGDAGALASANEIYARGSDRQPLLDLAVKGNAFAALMLERAYQLVSFGPLSVGESERWRDHALRAGTLARLQPLAAQNNTTAMVWLARVHDLGLQGQPKNAALSVAWNRKGAELGDSVAQVNLGFAFHQGKGVTKDLAQARDWYGKAAAQGSPVGIANLAVLFRFGEGVPKDPVRALQGFRQAADMGFGNAQFHLAQMLEAGEGVPADLAQAAPWYLKAAQQNVVNAQAKVGFMYSSGKGLAMDKAQAALWIRKAAEAGHVASQYNLAHAYDTGAGVPKDEAQAFAWHQKAAAGGDADSMYEVTLSLVDGKRGVPINLVEGMQWAQKSAEAGNRRAMAALGNMLYLGGRFAESDAWLRRAKAAGYPFTQEGVERAAKVLALTQRAQAGDTDQMYQLGKLYMSLGDRIPGSTNRASAARWLQASADQNNTYAMTSLADLALSNNQGREAVAWLERAHARIKARYESDNAPSSNLDRIRMSDLEHRIGVAYADGVGGMPPNPTAAFPWLLSAAERSMSSELLRRVAQAYASGSGVARDPQQAAAWNARAQNLDDALKARREHMQEQLNQRSQDTGK